MNAEQVGRWELCKGIAKTLGMKCTVDYNCVELQVTRNGDFVFGFATVDELHIWLSGYRQRCAELLATELLAKQKDVDTTTGKGNTK